MGKILKGCAMDNKRDSGFTILDVIIVFAVIGILLAIAIPGIIRWLPDYKLRAEGRNLLSTMQLARLRAVKENAHVVALFDTDNNSYEVFVDNNDSWTRDVGESIVTNSSIPAKINMYEASFSGGVPRVRFDGRGFPNGAGGHVYLLNINSKYIALRLSIVGHSRIEISDDGATWN